MVVQSAAVCIRTDRRGSSGSQESRDRQPGGPRIRGVGGSLGKHRVSLAWLGRQAIIEFLERRESEDLQLPLILSSERPPSGR